MIWGGGLNKSSGGGGLDKSGGPDLLRYLEYVESILFGNEHVEVDVVSPNPGSNPRSNPRSNAKANPRSNPRSNPRVES